MKQRTSRKAARGPEWAVTVRLNNGAVLYYTGLTTLEEWSPRERQAHRYEAEADARAFALTCQTNGSAKEYSVIQLGQPR